jgi:hypothetical protein
MTQDFDTPAEELRWLDKLVDGELDDAQRRQALLHLENQPDGWRRCALAFLEAQAWKKSLGTIAATPAKDVLVKPARANSSWANRWSSLLAAAASFLVAFGLGLAWRGHAERTELAAVKQPAPATQPRRAPQPELGLASDKPQWSTMTVNLDRDNDGIAEAVELPVVRGPGIDEAWVRSQPAAIPSPLLRALERMGHEVRHERQYYPFDLGDGRRLLVPVDEVDVRYGGERQFQ